jgi:hypothetical protein
MSEEEKRILDMLAGGTISADEAYELLNALRPVAGVENTDDLAFPARGDESEKIQRMQAGLQRFRRLWRIPAFVVAGALLLSGTGLFLMYQSTADVAAIGLLCTWSIFLVALLGAIFALLSRRSAWLPLCLWYARAAEPGRLELEACQAFRSQKSACPFGNGGRLCQRHAS